MACICIRGEELGTGAVPRRDTHNLPRLVVLGDVDLTAGVCERSADVRADHAVAPRAVAGHRMLKVLCSRPVRKRARTERRTRTEVKALVQRVGCRQELLVCGVLDSDPDRR